MPGDPAAQTTHTHTHTHTHTQKQTATSVAFWCILMALSQQSEARCRQYSAVATLKVWSRDLWSCPQVLSHRAPCSEGLVLHLRLRCGCLEILNNFWPRDSSHLPANYVADLSCLKPFHGIHEFKTILVIMMMMIILLYYLPFPLSFLLKYVHSGNFQRLYELELYCIRSNAEADMRIQLFTLKPDITEICRFEKQCHSAHHIYFAFGKQFS